MEALGQHFNQISVLHSKINKKMGNSKVVLQDVAKSSLSPKKYNP